MVSRIASLFLVLAVAGNLMAGTPVHSDGTETGMMECCKKALEHDASPRVSAARLCCALNCNEPGSTSSNTSQSFSQSAPEPTSVIALTLPAASIRHLRTPYRQVTLSSSSPTYILNLALL